MKKFLIIAVSGFVFFACQQNKSTHQNPAATQTPTPAATAGLVWAGDSDLVCGMHIDQSVEDTVHYQGKIYGFCSSNCKADFVKDPTQYVK